MADGWGKIMVGTRLEKQVEDRFVECWSELLSSGVRSGDGYCLVRGQAQCKGLNTIVRMFLGGDFDSLLVLDSDADIDGRFLEEFRMLEAGWKYDALQAFYVRRGWPPEAIWFKKTALGDFVQCVVSDPDATEDTAMIGTHCALFRREVFERIYEIDGAAQGISRDDFEWFYFPRHKRTGEDGAFSQDMTRHGFKIGATTSIKVGHITRLTTGWQTYQEFLQMNGVHEQIKAMHENIDLVAEFLGEDRDHVEALALHGSEQLAPAWKAANPQTPEQVREFYGKRESGYFGDLISWNASPGYTEMVAPLKDVKGKNVLVIGPGIGGEIDVLYERNSVTAFELPGALRDFLRFKYKDKPVLFGDETNFGLFADCHGSDHYDLIVAMDVVEHVHPNEISGWLDCVYGLLAPGGKFFAHPNFGQQDLYPMHFDHSAAWAAWTAQYFTQDNVLTWTRLP